jgi:hypothetical protein
VTTIRVDTNAVEVGEGLRFLFRDQVPFATARAINKTAEQFQKVQRDHMSSIFLVRRKPFIDRAVKIKPFARKTSLFADVSIDPPGGQARASILTQHETETVKTPRGRRVAIPDKIRRSPRTVVRKALRPANLGLRDAGTIDVGGTTATLGVAPGGIYSIRRPDGSGGIFRRRHRDRPYERLYVFRPQVPLTPELNFVKNADRVVQDRFAANFREAFDQAVRTAR